MKDSPPADIGELIGYQLHLADLIALRAARAALAGRQTTPARVTALAFLRGNPGCDQSTLGRFLDVNRSSAMKMVNALEDQGLIERRQGRDRRSNGLHLTEAGRAALDEMIGILRTAEARLTQGLAPAERAELLRLLVKLRGERQGGERLAEASLLPAAE